MSVHEGHRERLKETFRKNSLSVFNEINALELLLFYAIPRRDTNAIAHALLERFKTLDRVFEATYEELLEVPGIGENAAILIKLVPDIMKLSAVSATKSIVQIRTQSEYERFFIPRFMNERDEVFIMVGLNNKSEIIDCVELGRGDLNSVFASPRKVTETALRMNASYVILAHNHPHGLPTPSSDDIILTRKIKQALELVDVVMYDHIIVAGNRMSFVSETGVVKRFGRSVM